MNEQDNEKSEEDDRPWEQPGEERRDSLPDRGKLLIQWATTGFLINLASLIIGPMTLIGIPLCLLVVVVAQRDLAEIRAGTKFRSGEGMTRSARILAIAGLVFGLIAVGFWGMVTVNCLTTPYSSWGD